MLQGCWLYPEPNVFTYTKDPERGFFLGFCCSHQKPPPVEQMLGAALPTEHFWILFSLFPRILAISPKLPFVAICCPNPTAMLFVHVYLYVFLYIYCSRCIHCSRCVMQQVSTALLLFSCFFIVKCYFSAKYGCLFHEKLKNCIPQNR